MEITKQQIEKMATEYAKQFDYAEDSSPFLDYIAGFEKALSLFAVSGQSEQLVCDKCVDGLSKSKSFKKGTCVHCRKEIKQTNCH